MVSFFPLSSLDVDQGCKLGGKSGATSHLLCIKLGRGADPPTSLRVRPFRVGFHHIVRNAADEKCVRLVWGSRGGRESEGSLHREPQQLLGMGDIRPCYPSASPSTASVGVVLVVLNDRSLNLLTRFHAPGRASRGGLDR